MRTNKWIQWSEIIGSIAVICMMISSSIFACFINYAVFFYHTPPPSLWLMWALWTVCNLPILFIPAVWMLVKGNKELEKEYANSSD
jgi:hypothetical protein